MHICVKEKVRLRDYLPSIETEQAIKFDGRYSYEHTNLPSCKWLEKHQSQKKKKITHLG